jgi:heme-degrading monooxygenase HmoA
MQPLTFIVPFEVPEGQEDVMRKQWHEAAEPLSHERGFLSARLYEIDNEVEDYVHRIPGMKWVGERRFRFVNIAEWASLADYEAAIRSRREGKPIAFPSYPAYYRLYSNFGKAAEQTAPKRISAGPAFTFIVPFEVPEGQEEDMYRQWNAVITGMGQTEGGRVEGSFGPGLYELDTEAEKHLRSFLSSQIGEGPDARAKFRFVNVAGWASLADYEATLRSRRYMKPISFPGHGSYYRVAAEYSGSQEEQSTS